MCISVPAKIISIAGKSAEVEVYSKRRKVFLGFEEAMIGDWVLLYGELALTRLDEREALATLDLLSRLA